MASVFLIAIASGAMGAITAVATADDEMRQSILHEGLDDKQKQIMSMCETCADHIDRHNLTIGDQLQNSPAMRVCEKITTMNGPKLKSLIKKFLQSSKIDVEKLKKLAEMCEKDESVLCKAVDEITSTAAREELLSADQIRECADDVSRAYRNLKIEMPKDEWMEAEDFEWGSDDDVESRVSAYSNL